MIYLKAVLLAFVEGVTEFLPISSTGHLILIDEFLVLSDDVGFRNEFTVIVQLPAIASVLVYFWKDLWPFGSSDERRHELCQLWAKILVAVLPALVIGFFAHDYIVAHLFSPLPVALALFLGGVILIFVERIKHRVTMNLVTDITFRMALVIGLIQCFAMIPGTSRSAVTIIGAILLGASRPAAAEFSFFLAIPTMIAATAYSLAKSGLDFTTEQWLVLAVASLVSFGVAYGAIAAFMRYIRHRSFAVFGYYRIVLALLVIMAWRFGVIMTAD
ncbi:MAG: undecaprenyl-diphosphate phosphatase [Candidatus Hydrogenedentes bacterium]|nr:undecaprenyl-diphosphate phosphatase [Candidatus Hydrogenedentota bacterium]